MNGKMYVQFFEKVSFSFYGHRFVSHNDFQLTPLLQGKCQLISRRIPPTADPTVETGHNVSTRRNVGALRGGDQGSLQLILSWK